MKFTKHSGFICDNYYTYYFNFLSAYIGISNRYTQKFTWRKVIIQKLLDATHDAVICISIKIQLTIIMLN